mmetsp:Transcript_1372/g.2585  ORF Transcript_1372/g.2585 Transcript_1372/m.2585 type:complete len:101 (+) Transcript_1372:440-742(+)
MLRLDEDETRVGGALSEAVSAVLVRLPFDSPRHGTPLNSGKRSCPMEKIHKVIASDRGVSTCLHVLDGKNLNIDSDQRNTHLFNISSLFRAAETMKDALP